MRKVQKPENHTYMTYITHNNGKMVIYRTGSKSMNKDVKYVLLIKRQEFQMNQNGVVYYTIIVYLKRNRI